MIKHWCIAILCIVTFSCKKHYEAPVPETKWNLFDSPASTSLTNETRNKLEGVYSVSEGADVFGASAALKWSYTVNGSDTTYQLSMFCERQVVYVICEGKRLDSSILLNGYWRNVVNTETGIARFTISKNTGGGYLLDSSTLNAVPGTIITGLYGTAQDTTRIVRMQYNRPLYKATPLEIVAHRGGGRTSDLLPASENTAEIIKLASSFGATGIEIDVRLTKDGVPVLFHDETINERLIQRNGMIGPIENYTYAQLNSLVRLIKGERIPTLREALDVVVYKTPLKYVWLDTKFKGSIQKERDIQVEYQQKAAAIGRELNITIGIPDQGVLDNFVKLKDYRNIPSVVELTPQDVTNTNAQIWAPRWTLGLQNEEVDKMHSAGRKAYVWTLDVPENISKYFAQGKFDGILTNYPSSVAYYYYAKK
ncbi:MAG: glycerophosphodiester phosphodiesterase [Segetibacter sp.]|jgi:glycerophosphoryl diester phosphodiesterase|nr:glycerophosphodiester phosphodiesterase [Segetibacter sp.]